MPQKAGWVIFWLSRIAGVKSAHMPEILCGVWEIPVDKKVIHGDYTCSQLAVALISRANASNKIA